MCSQANYSAEAALVETEQRRLRSLVEGDLVLADSLHHADFQLITPAAMALSKQEYLDAIADGAINYHVWEPERISARVTGDAGCVRYASTIDMSFQGQRTGPDRYWHTDYYERNGDAWQVVWSHATGPIG